MRTIVIVLAALTLAPAAPAQVFNGELAKPRDVQTDLGCLQGSQRAHRFPTTQYDPGAHERVTYDLSPCTGGYIRGVNTDTWKTWNADVKADRSMSGTDLDGARWKYDPQARLYTNFTSGKSCAKTSLRHVCPA